MAALSDRDAYPFSFHFFNINLISYVIIPVILPVYLLVVFSRYMSSIPLPVTVDRLD